MNSFSSLQVAVETCYQVMPWLLGETKAYVKSGLCFSFSFCCCASPALLRGAVAVCYHSILPAHPLRLEEGEAEGDICWLGDGLWTLDHHGQNRLWNAEKRSLQGPGAWCWVVKD